MQLNIYFILFFVDDGDNRDILCDLRSGVSGLPQLLHIVC